MTSSLIIGMLVAMLAGLKTNSMVIAAITFIVVSAAAYFAFRLLHAAMDRGIDAASDVISKAMEKKDGDKS